MLVGGQVVPLCIPGILISSGSLQIYLELGTCFDCFRPGAAIARVLDEIQTAKDDVFVYIQVFRIFLQRILSGHHIQPVDGLIQKIPLRGCDLTNVPALAAGIVVGQKISILIRHIGIYQLVVAVNTVDRPSKGGVALRLTIGVAQLCHNAVRVE